MEFSLDKFYEPLIRYLIFNTIFNIQVLDSPSGDTKITIPEKPALPSSSVNTPEKLEQLRKTITVSLDRTSVAVKKLLVWELMSCHDFSG